MNIEAPFDGRRSYSSRVVFGIDSRSELFLPGTGLSRRVVGHLKSAAAHYKAQAAFVRPDDSTEFVIAILNRGKVKPL